jgi:hypothetical protein
MNVRKIILLAKRLAPLTSLHVANVENLRCEYLKDPLGIDAARPRLSWVMGHWRTTCLIYIPDLFMCNRLDWILQRINPFGNTPANTTLSL